MAGLVFFVLILPFHFTNNCSVGLHGQHSLSISPRSVFGSEGCYFIVPELNIRVWSDSGCFFPLQILL